MTLVVPLVLVTFAPSAAALPGGAFSAGGVVSRTGGPLGLDVTISSTSPEPTRPIEPTAFDSLIEAAALKHGVSDQLIRAIIETESDFDPLALSAKGACGLMQLMPLTAERFGVIDCFDARENILAGTHYLKELLIRYDGSVSLAVAAYNAGAGAVARHRGIPPYRQTQAYVRKVSALLAARAQERPGSALEVS